MSLPPLSIQIEIFRFREVKHLVQGNTAEKQWYQYLNLIVSTGGHISRGLVGFLEAGLGLQLQGNWSQSSSETARAPV